MSIRRETWLPLAIAAAFLTLALGGQAVGDRIVAAPSNATTAAVGRASLSYLTGIRRYAGAVLWNRVEPLLHGYYDGVPLYEQRYMLSTIAAVEWLDPTFDQPYYVGSWILSRNGKVSEGLDMARRGTERIPQSGTLHMSYAQMLFVLKRDVKGAVEQSMLAVEPSMSWADDVEKINGYAAIEQLLRQAGETARADAVAVEIDRLDEIVGKTAPTDVHDHNGDGTPDH
ncbi:MAG: hypothetical protein D9V44_04415 [Actinobacteria bacterium]|nr:MAG: hypothetical protein D9V44_04415 [Actinomycetota bacterium]